MLHDPDPFATSRLHQLIGDKPVQRPEVEVGQPRAGVVTDRKPGWNVVLCTRRTVDDLVHNFQKSTIFDRVVQHGTEPVQFYRLIEMPDIQFHEILAVTGPNPALNISPGILDAALRHVSATVAIHACGQDLLNGEHCHPLHNMIMQPGDFDVPRFSIRHDVSFLSRKMLPSAF